MLKRQRLNVIRETNRAWWARRLGLAIPAAIGVYVLMTLEARGWIGFLLLGLLIVLSARLFTKETDELKRLTDHPDVKRIITMQYRLEVLFISLIAVANPLAIRLMAWSWVPFVLLFGAALCMLYAQTKFDEQIRRLDPEQPTRRDVRDVRFSSKA